MKSITGSLDGVGKMTCSRGSQPGRINPGAWCTARSLNPAKHCAFMICQYAPNRKFRGSTFHAAGLLVIPRDWNCSKAGKLSALIGDSITNNQQKVDGAPCCGLSTKTSATDMPGETRKARAAGINPVMLEMFRKRWFAA